jgi:tetratricopeptide (TPR) repeat protein
MYGHEPADVNRRRRGNFNPAFALAYNNRGDAWVNKGDLDRAIADFPKALEISPGPRTANDSLKRLGAAQ